MAKSQLTAVKPLIDKHIRRLIQGVNSVDMTDAKSNFEHLSKEMIDGLRGILQKKNGIIHHDFNKLGMELYQMHVPAILAIMETEAMEKDIISHFVNPVAAILDALNSARDWIAEAYFNEIIKDFMQNRPKRAEDLPDVGFGVRELYRSIDVIGKGKTGVIPVQDCPMHKFLNGPFMEMACPDQAFREHMNDHHRHIHYMVEKVIYFRDAGEFHNALIIYEILNATLYHQLFELQNVLSDFRACQEQYMFNFLRRMAAGGKRPVLGILDIGRMDAINRMFGRREGDRLLVKLQLDTQKMVEQQKIDGFTLRGLHGDILMVFNTFDKWESWIRRKLNAVKSRDKLAGKIPVIVSAGFIEIQLGINQEEYRFIKEHTRQMAKKSPDRWLVMDQSRARTGVDMSHAILDDADLVIAALNEGTIKAFYQPIVDLKTGTLCHLEALARVPDKGRWLPVGRFIKIIEELGMYPRLDALMIRQVVNDAAKLREMVDQVMINISPVTLLSREGIDAIVNGIMDIRSRDLDVAFEVTEQVFLDSPGVLEFLAKEHDVFFSVDDFGTGFASISSTIELADKRLIKTLKIDGSLVQGLTTTKKKRRIVATIADMAANLGLKNIAEFVEDEDTIRLLLKMGVEMGQGYYFAKAMPVESIREWVLARGKKT